MDLSGQNREREWILIIPSFKSVEEMSTVDSCYVRLWYAFNADRIENQNTYVDLQRLEVGKNIIAILLLIQILFVPFGEGIIQWRKAGLVV